MDHPLLKLLPIHRGHFRYESGHHGDLWLDLDALLARPAALRPFADELAERLSVHRIDAVCGPLVGGAFLAQLVAERLKVEFYYSERVEPPTVATGVPVEYRMPKGLRTATNGISIAVVDDAINAGSAVHSTISALQACGARTAVVGALVVLGSQSMTFFAKQGIPMVALASIPNRLWSADDCPLCAGGVVLDNSQDTH